MLDGEDKRAIHSELDGRSVDRGSLNHSDGGGRGRFSAFLVDLQERFMGDGVDFERLFDLQ